MHLRRRSCVFTGSKWVELISDSYSYAFAKDFFILQTIIHTLCLSPDRMCAGLKTDSKNCWKYSWKLSRVNTYSRNKMIIIFHKNYRPIVLSSSSFCGRARFCRYFFILCPKAAEGPKIWGAYSNLEGIICHPGYNLANWSAKKGMPPPPSIIFLPTPLFVLKTNSSKHPCQRQNA